MLPETFDLVTGEKKLQFKVILCRDHRAESNRPDLCGTEGKWYELYVRPSYLETVEEQEVVKRSKKKLSADDLENL